MATECDMQLSRMVAAEARIAECRLRARSALDQARVCRLQALLYTLRGDYQAAIDSAISGLDLLGMSPVRGVDWQQVEASHAHVQTLVEQKGRHCLESLQRTDSEEVTVAISLLATLSSSFS